MPGSTGASGAFTALGAVVGPLMMLLIALQKPGPVRTLLKAEADSPERARKMATLGLSEPPLLPLIRAGVVVREADGRIWVDRAKARRRQWRIGAIIGGAIVIVSGIVALILTH
ncbi:MAG: hypothetical protein RL591_715 [Planctomycetota bacterium]